MPPKSGSGKKPASGRKPASPMNQSGKGGGRSSNGQGAGTAKQGSMKATPTKGPQFGMRGKREAGGKKPAPGASRTNKTGK